MAELNSPANASPTTLAGMNPPPPATGGDEDQGKPPANGSNGSMGSGEGDSGKSQNSKLNQDIQSLRTMEAQMLEMAQSYPTATKALRTASESLRAAQRQIVSSPGMAEPPKPNTFA